jgi:hypothetical protein
MKYSQKSYPSIKLGTCADSISQSGCFLVSFVNLLNELKISDIDPVAFNKKAYPSGGCMANAQIWADMYAMTYQRLSVDPKEICIAETNYYAKNGVPQHFMLYNQGQRIDPLDTKPSWEQNTYPIVSYRLFKLKNEPMAVDKNEVAILKAISSLSGKDYGDNANDGETKDIIKFLGGLKEDVKAFNDDLRKKNEEIERQRKEIVGLKTTIYNRDQDIKNKTAVIETLNERITELEKAPVVEEPKTLGYYILGIWSIISGIKK